MAEDLSEYLASRGVRVRYMHSDINSIDRVEILRELRLGMFDVLVGINLLREGLDLPEVSLVAILDADKEGFLRSETSLIQTIGRAARHLAGMAVMYADRITGSMERAIRETDRRRAIQAEYNQEHGIEPRSIVKSVEQIRFTTSVADARVAERPSERDAFGGVDPAELARRLEAEMKEAAQALDFERAARLRDELFEVRTAMDTGKGRRRSGSAGRPGRWGSR
jgi:excinuclease ABC subunit B